MDGAQDFDGLFGISDRRTDERLFPRTALATRIARGAVPRGRNDALIVFDCAVLDAHPVPQRAAWRFEESPALGFRRPFRWIPFLAVVHFEIAAFDVRRELIHPALQLLREDKRFDAACGGATEGREERFGSDAERF